MNSFYISNTELYHHGIKGQKWGVRRFQNEDGSLTEAGKKRYTSRKNIINNRPYTNDVNDIVRTLSKSDKQKLGAPIHEDWIEKDAESKILANKVKTFIEKVGDTPVSFSEIYVDDNRTGEIAIGTRSGAKYRNKGYASKVAKQCNDWIERYGKYRMDEVYWIARSDNYASKKLANKYGFKYAKTEIANDGNFDYYSKKLK